MALINSSIPNLINGVSQQPYALRLSSQAEIQTNALSSVVEGLRKRPPSRYEFTIDAAADFASNKVLSHQINRDTSERYQVLITDKTIRVWDLRTKTAIPVAFKDGSKSYLTCTSPATQLRALTVADYTFVLNRTKTILSDTEVVPKYRPDALVWVRQGAYGAQYSVTLDGTKVTYRTPGRGSEGGGGPGIYESDDQVVVPAPTGYVAEPPRLLPKVLSAQHAATDNIAKALYDLLRLNPTLSLKFEFSLSGSLIRVRTKGVQRNDPINGQIITYDDFDLTVTDSQGDTILKAFKDRTQNFTELPARCFNGFRIKVMGDGATRFDDYYVQYKGDGSRVGGVWEEDIADEQRYKLNSSTMPHALIRKADGTFSFEAIDWEPRKVGDSVSNPLPSFVGKKAQDLFFYRNRFGICAQENVVMSRFGDFFNFFKQSATQIVDTDPIDVAVSHTKVSDINHVVAYNETLLLFAQGVQFQIGRTETLTPKTISFSQTTEFNCSAKCKPVGAGPYIYFAYDRGRFSGIREYYVDDVNATNDATDITSHVPRYIAGDIDFMTSSANEDMILALSSKEKNVIYVYKYYFAGDEKLQSSWSKWVFDEEVDILSATFIDSTLWMAVLRDGNVVMESMDLSPNLTDPGFDYVIHLDRRLDETTAPPVYLEGANITTITLPYPYVPGMIIVAKDGNPEFPTSSVGLNLFKGFIEGQVVPYEVYTDNRGVSSLRVQNNLSYYWIGVPYTMQYRFSTLTLKDGDGAGGQKAVVDGRTQLRKMALRYADSGYFRVEVDLAGPGRSFQYPMTAKITGVLGTRVNRNRITSGIFNFPILSENDKCTIDIVNDNFMPCNILSAEWEALFITRSRRV